MNFHATRTRRQFFGSLAGAATTAAGMSIALRNGRLDAAGGAPRGTADLVDGAAATKPAIRVSRAGELLLPADPTGGGLVCLNNFRGNSNSNGPCGHNGTDIGELDDNTPGRPLVACTDGVVERDGSLSSAGMFRMLRGDDGNYYRYHHLDAYASDLAEGDRVTRGDTIGYMGTTGNTTWTHLHFEVWLNSPIPRDGTVVDPVPLIEFPAGVQLDPSRACDA